MQSETPKYREIANWIKDQIAQGKMKEGQRLYSENQLKDMFGISRQTARHAISYLEEQKLVKRVRGSGTYITLPKKQSQSGKTRVAVITTYVDGYIFPKMIKGIENHLANHGYTIQLAFTNNRMSRERQILQDILQQEDVCGIITEATKSALPNPNLDLYEKIQDKNIPIIFINSFYPDLDVPHVSINDKHVGKIMTEYLISKGHKRIGAIMKLDDGQGRLRCAGYLQAMVAANLPTGGEQIAWIDTIDMRNLEENISIQDRILKRLEGCTAVLCYNDELAFSFLKVLDQRGIHVPEEISVVGIDDSELAVQGDVKFTTTPHPSEDLGIRAAENLVGILDNPLFDATYEYDLGVVERNSVKTI